MTAGPSSDQSSVFTEPKQRVDLPGPWDVVRQAACAPSCRGSCGSSQAERCAARYRTHDPRTSTYVANGAGERRACRL